MRTLTSTPSPIGRPSYSQTMPCAAPSAAEARRLVRIALGVWSLETLADGAELIVSELVGNAVRHTRCRLIRVTVTRIAPGAVRIGVTDTSNAPPVWRRAGAEDVRGRGLAVVAAVASRWGTDSLPWGKRMWAELIREPPP